MSKSGDRLLAGSCAGCLYFVVVFSCGFALGVLRTLVLAPRFGSEIALMLEVPVMLILSWLTASAILRRRAWPGFAVERIAMAATALALLAVAEILLARLIFGQTMADFLSHYRTPASLAGLAGQLAFAILPLFIALPKGKKA